jgi:hypothetical protein
MLQLRSLSLCLAVAGSVYAEPPKAVSELAGLDRAYPSLDALYQDLHLGASDPVEFAKAKEKGTLPPGPHNDGFAPVREPTIRAGVSALTVSVLELLGKAPTRG